MAATLDIDVNSTSKAVLRFVGGGSVVTANSLAINNHSYNWISVTRIMWTGPTWTITAANSEVVFDSGNSAWGVFDYADRGSIIPKLANSSASFTVTGTGGTLQLEITKSP